MEQSGTNYVTVEIYDQTYHLSGQDADHIRALAAKVDAKMRAVAAQGRTVEPPRESDMLAPQAFAGFSTKSSKKKERRPHRPTSKPVFTN
jgi:hypothetical protein